MKPLPYVKRFVDRHGKARYYYRRKGWPTVALPSPLEGMQAFLAAYARAEGSQPARAPERTLEALIAAYLASPEYRALKAGFARTVPVRDPLAAQAPVHGPPGCGCDTRPDQDHARRACGDDAGQGERRAACVPRSDVLRRRAWMANGEPRPSPQDDQGGRASVVDGCRVIAV